MLLAESPPGSTSNSTLMTWSTKIDYALPRPLRALLRGVGQVFFCGNAVAGAVFLVALYVGDLSAGFAATLGGLSSTATAYLLGFSQEDLDAGLFGFNGTLIGPCLFLLLESSPWLWLCVVLGAALSTVVMAALMQFLRSYELPAATAPFVSTSWMFVAATHAFGVFSLRAAPSPSSTPASLADLTLLPATSWFTALTKGIGEVMFADSAVVGLLFLVGIALTSVRGALLAVGGAVVGAGVSLVLGADRAAIELGLFGFNPALTMMAVGWALLEPGRASALLALAAGFATVICQAGLAQILAPSGLPTLTFPFVLTTWVFLLAASRSRRWAS